MCYTVFTMTTITQTIAYFRHYCGERYPVRPPAFIERSAASSFVCDPFATTLYFHSEGGSGYYAPPPCRDYYSAQRN